MHDQSEVCLFYAGTTLKRAGSGRKHPSLCCVYEALYGGLHCGTEAIHRSCATYGQLCVVDTCMANHTLADDLDVRKKDGSVCLNKQVCIPEVSQRE